jgi:hypothetical protein
VRTRMGHLATSPRTIHHMLWLYCARIITYSLKKSIKMHKYNHYVEDLLGKSPIASMAPTTNLISQLWAHMNITCIPTDPTIESWCMLMTYSINVNVSVTEENCGPCKHHHLYLTKSNHGIPFKNLLAVWVFLV